MMIPFGVLVWCVPTDLDELVEVYFGGVKSVFHRILIHDDAFQWKKILHTAHSHDHNSSTVRVHKKKKNRYKNTKKKK